MDHFRQIGEVLGSLKALMVLKHDILINQRQCCLLFDMYDFAFETISGEIRQNLRLDERNTMWKPLQNPLRELHSIFKEGEQYITYCLDVKDWWGKAISLHLNRECVDFHIHNLLCCFPVVIEAIETVAEFSVTELEDMEKRRSALMRKYESDWDDPRIFQWMYGKQYLVPREICTRLDSAWKEDGWLILETIREKKTAVPTTLAKHEQKLGDLLLNKLNRLQPQKHKLLPTSVLVGGHDYFVKKRLGLGEGNVKEIQWLGESFAMRTFFGDLKPLNEEISLVFSLSHPNILQYHCGFYDEERKEGFLVMELMSKNLKTYIKENSGQRKRLPFSVPVAVDIMLQIARGLEYLHSKRVYHGELNPSNILLKARSCSTEGCFHAKLTGFGLISIKSYTRSPRSEVDPVIWYAPEVLAEQEQPGKGNAKYSEKADAYSFGMLCFEILTGKVPFEDSHLQGDKMVRNIRAGERPLFPYSAPKYLANLTRKCWHPNPAHRPSFSAICRILRYIKMILVINPDHGQPESPPPLVDYLDIEASYSKHFTEEKSVDLAHVSQIPFQLYAYRIIQKEKTLGSIDDDKNWDMGNEELPDRPASICGGEHLDAIDDLFLVPSDQRSVCSEIIESRHIRSFAQRTVISEIPHKLFSSDQRSIGSESPGRKSLLATSADQRSVFADTAEWKVSGARSADQSSIPSRTPERKPPPTLAMNQKEKADDSKAQNAAAEVPEQTVGRDIPEKEKPTAAAAAGHGLISSGVSERTIPGKKKITHRRKLSQIPEKAVSASLLKKPDAPEKNSSSKSAHSKNSEKKTSWNKKQKEISIPKRTGFWNDNLPKSSPTTTSKNLRRSSTSKSLSFSSAAASPTRGSIQTSKSFSFSSVAALPTNGRRLSSSLASKDYPPPQSSPMNPCFRRSRTTRETTLTWQT